ncbi:unnamed protein product [Cylindrotheca closterium]|uniref:Uncharacterized protein n=1 Tax=Cylindrotheca closterium TaxID=2856 RepID=A0AAD2G093_9STRA|nr:unnamed protein product [Cylindrotheca closterium]
MPVGQRATAIETGQLNLDGGNVFMKGGGGGGLLKNAKDSFDYDTEPVTSSSSDEEDVFADISLHDNVDDEEEDEYTKPVKSGSADASEQGTVFSASTKGSSKKGRATIIAAKRSNSMTRVDSIREINSMAEQQQPQKKGLDSDMIHVSGYLRLDIHTQFLLSEHGIRSLDDLGSLRPKKWKHIHNLVKSVTGDDEQARKLAVLRQWIRSIQIPVDEGDRIPSDWRPLFLKALPQLKADARRTDWTNSEDVQMRFIDAMPYSITNFITSLSQCGIALPWESEFE